MTDEPPARDTRPRGRPRAPVPVKTSVTTWIRASDYDRLIHRAQREEKTLSALVRDLLTRRRD